MLNTSLVARVAPVDAEKVLFLLLLFSLDLNFAFVLAVDASKNLQKEMLIVVGLKFKEQSSSFKFNLFISRQNVFIYFFLVLALC